MKWFFGVAMWLALSAGRAASPQMPEIIGGYCCDERDVAVCKVWPFQPVGNTCWCPGMKPDGGHVCL